MIQIKKMVGAISLFCLLLLCGGCGMFSLMNEADWARLDVAMSDLSDEDKASMIEEFHTIQADHEEKLTETFQGLASTVMDMAGKLAGVDLQGIAGAVVELKEAMKPPELPLIKEEEGGIDLAEASGMGGGILAALVSILGLIKSMKNSEEGKLLGPVFAAVKAKK